MKAKVYDWSFRANLPALLGAVIGAIGAWLAPKPLLLALHNPLNFAWFLVFLLATHSVCQDVKRWWKARKVPHFKDKTGY